MTEIVSIVYDVSGYIEERLESEGIEASETWKDEVCLDIAIGALEAADSAIDALPPQGKD